MTERAAPPARDAGEWVGSVVDTLDGVEVGRVAAIYVDAADSGAASWAVVALRRGGLLGRVWRRFGGARVAVPARDCAAMPGRVWTGHAAGAIRTAPTVDPRRPLLREHELAICAHYGIGERVGRCAEALARPEGEVSSQPASATAAA